ncbi:hypothetical protein CcaCcLH18_02301 [Colletotrichum camelliae]|nr:hypothetical protein CcaCcLH18_02301 [Colletotrichum camelliae]
MAFPRPEVNHNSSNSTAQLLQSPIDLGGRDRRNLASCLPPVPGCPSMRRRTCYAVDENRLASCEASPVSEGLDFRLSDVTTAGEELSQCLTRVCYLQADTQIILLQQNCVNLRYRRRVHDLMARLSGRPLQPGFRPSPTGTSRYTAFPGIQK